MAKGSALVRTALRGVGRRSRDPHAGVRITSIDMVRYVGPGRALVHSYGMVVWLRATDGEVSHYGIGEAVAAPAQAAGAWRRLRDLASALIGSPLPGRVDPTHPLRDIDGWQPVRPVDSGAVRAAKLALEIALLDLLMATGAMPSLGAAEPPPPLRTYKLPGLAPGGRNDKLSAVLRADDGSGWAVRLRSTGDTALDLDWLRRVTELERAAGRDRPVWLVGGERDLAAASAMAERVAELIREGRVPGLVLWEEPLARKPRSPLGKYQERSALSKLAPRSPLSRLQQTADEALGRTSGQRTAGPRLAIVASDSVSSVAQVQRLTESWPVGGFYLSPARWGSMAAFQEAARLAKAHDPATLVLLGGGRGSRLSGLALQWLATTTREIDRYVPEQPAATWPTLAVAGGGAPGSGLYQGVDLAELATVADEVTAVPREPRPPTTEPPNRFPDQPLPGEALASSSTLLEIEALRFGLTTRRTSTEAFVAEHPDSGAVIGFTETEPSRATPPTAVSAARTRITRDLLAAAGLPVPAGASFGPLSQPEQRRAAYAEARRLGFPLVIKPAGGEGRGTTVGVTSEQQLRRALDEVAGADRAAGVVVERYVTGTRYRVLTTARRVLSVVRLEPATVVGDGQRSIEELVVAANAARRQNPYLAARLITLDAQVDEQLARQGLTRRSVPGLGRRVRLRAEASLSLAAESFEVLDATHPSVSDLAMAVVAAVPGLPYAGLELVMEDHRLPVERQSVTILEVSSRPEQVVHQFPMYGPARDVSQQLVRDTAVAAGCKLRQPTSDLTVRVTLTGRVQGVGYRRWLVRAATELGVSGWVCNAAEADQVYAMMHGKAARVGMMLRLAFDGPPGATVRELVAEPVDVAPASGFAIHPDAVR